MSLLVRIPEGKIADILSAEADRRSCRPDQLAVALISCAADGNLIDAILDDLNPASVASFKPKRSSLQIRVLMALMAFHAPSGVLVASMSDIARRLNTSNRGAVRNAVHGLIRKNIIELVEVGRAGHSASRYRLTEEGKTFFGELHR